MSAKDEQSWVLGDKFDTVHPHLESIEALWEKKWKYEIYAVSSPYHVLNAIRFPCTRSLYPFHDGKFEDFEPIFNALIAKGINSGYTDEYTTEFIPTFDSLVSKADSLVASDPTEAASLYLRAGTVGRLARFPYINSDLKREIYAKQRSAYLKGAALWESPIEDISIPHAAAVSVDGDTIPLYIRIPPGTSASKPAPTMIILCGLDGHRPDNTTRTDEALARGWASVILDIPGTADCPADRSDPASSDRLATSVLDWMSRDGRFDMRRVLVWGLSAGGYHAVRLAHAHHDRILGVVAQGAGTHHFFSEAWLAKAQNHEYPWNIVPALAEKFGVTGQELLAGALQRRWSLVESGLLDGPSARLLLVNGMHDGLMPVEDSLLCFEHGRPKEGRFFSGLLHMGYPPANGSVYPWMEQVMASVPDGRVDSPAMKAT